jgi:hypothetical protein
MIYQVSVSAINQFDGSKFKANKHGVWPVILNSINGAILPENSSILDGSIAESIGLKAGSTYSLFISSRESQKIGDKVYKNYNYAVVGDITASLGIQLAAAAISSISSMFAPSPAQMLLAQTPSPAPTPQPVLSQPVVDADDEPEMSDEELAAQIKLLQAQAKARKEVAKKEPAEEAAPF